jgi:sugar/nucleoside kinase (ribokinase family)
VSTESPVVLVVGAASRDVVPDDPRGWRLGGAALFTSLALARLGLEVWAVVGADRDAAQARELDLLRDAGVALALADLASGPIFDNATHVLFSAADRMPLTVLPRRWTSGFDALLVVPVADEVGEEWAVLASGATPRLVALGWQGLLRRLVAGEVIRPRSPQPSSLLRAASLAVLSREDVAADARPEDFVALLAPGATLLWTEGPAGGLVVQAGSGDVPSVERYPAIPSDSVVDPTGAGDVFLAGMVAGLLQRSLGDPTTVAAAAASLTVEGAGLEGVPDLAAVRRRMTRAPSLASRRPSAVSSRNNGRPSQA